MAVQQPTTTSVVQTTTAITEGFQLPRQLSDGNSQGTVLGISATDLISFFGSTPIAQPTVGPGNTFATLTQNGTLTKYQFTNATTAIGATTTAEGTSTIGVTTQGGALQTTDAVQGNKPTATGGIGVAGYRVSAAAQVGITYSNVSTGGVTTSGETYDLVAISGAFCVTTALTPTSVAGTSVAEQTFSVAGATVGSCAIVNKPTSQAGLGVVNVRVTAPGQVAVQFINNSSGAITPTAGETYTFAFVPNIVPMDRKLLYRVTPATTAVGASTQVEVTTAVTGLLITDTITGVSKPSIQVGLGVTGYRVTSAGNLGISLYEGSSAVTSTLEAYAVSVERLQPLGVAVSTQTLTPVSVAAGVTAEQTFTVNFLNVSTSVLVNKPSLTPGIALVNARVSAASTLALTYENLTTNAIVPPAEAYVIANVQLQGPGAVATTGATTNSIAIGIGGADLPVRDLHNYMNSLGLIGSV
jgi:hypothetical protein